MSCTVEREDGVLKSMTFSCDHDGCDVVKKDDEIESRGGLRAMGWYCAGGKHWCPEHAEEARSQ